MVWVKLSMDCGMVHVWRIEDINAMAWYARYHINATFCMIYKFGFFKSYP